MANPAAGINTIVDLENAAKKAAACSSARAGPASIGHIYGEMMSRALGVKMTHVPYRGGAPMTTDLISGVIPVGIDVITAFVPFFKNGQIKPLAVTSAQRSPLAPDVPTVAESGHARSCSTTSSASPARRRCRRHRRPPQRRDQRGAGAARDRQAPARARRHRDAGHAGAVHEPS
jgi:tripartite-type tricarboxylate transporter receptor subunit TctC